MDDQRFDALTRRLGAGLTRRRSLHALLGGVGLAVLGRVAAEDAVAAPVCWSAKAVCVCAKGIGRRRCLKCCDLLPDQNTNGNNGSNGNNGNQRCRRNTKPCTRHGECCSKHCDNNVCRPAKKTCGGFKGSCATSGDCCAGLTCDSNQCVVDCPATLTAAGCTLNGNGTWNCGNTGGHAVDLSGVNISGCDLTNASFFQTDTSGAIMTETVLTGANFNDANVTGVAWNNTTCPGGTNSDANGDTCCGSFAFGQVPTGCHV